MLHFNKVNIHNFSLCREEARFNPNLNQVISVLSPRQVIFFCKLSFPSPDTKHVSAKQIEFCRHMFNFCSTANPPTFKSWTIIFRYPVSAGSLRKQCQSTPCAYLCNTKGTTEFHTLKWVTACVLSYELLRAQAANEICKRSQKFVLIPKMHETFFLPPSQMSIKLIINNFIFIFFCQKSNFENDVVV